MLNKATRVSSMYSITWGHSILHQKCYDQHFHHFFMVPTSHIMIFSEPSLVQISLKYLDEMLKTKQFSIYIYCLVHIHVHIEHTHHIMFVFIQNVINMIKITLHKELCIYHNSVGIIAPFTAILYGKVFTTL